MLKQPQWGQATSCVGNSMTGFIEGGHLQLGDVESPYSSRGVARIGGIGMVP